MQVSKTLHPTLRIVLAFFQSVTSLDAPPCWPDSAKAGEKPFPKPMSMPRFGFSWPRSSLGRLVVSESTAVWKAIAWDPSFSQISFTFAAMVSRASSQVIASNLPSPRSPTRFKGV